MTSEYKCKIDSSHPVMHTLDAAIRHVVTEANEKGLGGASPLGDYLAVFDRVTLERSEWNMILEMFATIEEQAGLTGDMLTLHKHLREQIPK